MLEVVPNDAENVVHRLMALSDRDLRWSRRLSYVPRWGVCPTIRQQSVAEHSFHMTQICLWLAYRNEEIAMDVSKMLNLIVQALGHDNDEAVTGDLPSTTKVPVVPDGQEKVILKCADHLEAIAFIAEEKALGNTRMDDVDVEIRFKFHSVWEKFEWLANYGKKPLSSDLIRLVLAQVMAKHPTLENRVDV